MPVLCFINERKKNQTTAKITMESLVFKCRGFVSEEAASVSGFILCLAFLGCH